MIEVIRAVRSKRSSIEEQFGKQAQLGRHSYAALSSIAIDHGLIITGLRLNKFLVDIV